MIAAPEHKSAGASLWDSLERVYRALAQGSAESQTDSSLSSLQPALPGEWNGIDALSELFGLTSFEQDILLLCAGAAIDSRFGPACAAVHQNAQMAWPSFALAAAALENPHWSALSRSRPLRYWQLIEIGEGPLLNAPLAIDESILQYLLRVPTSDKRLDLIIHPLIASSEGVHASGGALNDLAKRGVRHWMRPSRQRGCLLLSGGREEERTALFHLMCAQGGLNPYVLDSQDLPESPVEREQLARAFTREAALWPGALLVRTPRLENAPRLQAWLDRVDAPVAVHVDDGSPAESLAGLRLDVPSLNGEQRKAIWREHLGPLAEKLNGELDILVDVFALDTSEITRTALQLQEEAVLRQKAKTRVPISVAAWRLCRTSARRSLDELAVRIETQWKWDDLVLPEGQMGILRQIAAYARQTATVYRQWGFAERDFRGQGLSVLFAGASGTGKTMAAGVLAHELDRDLYQIDLSTVVSKYIGETEKHLRKIFDAAERSGAILLFDEADALFGKRSQVKDSHDRYANLEISYLLQRMETYRGIAVLTTNMQNSIDQAFQRRLKFIVQFPFPDAASRERIWRGAFPKAAPVEKLDYARLAQLGVTGGIIRNTALLAAFLAADEGVKIGMRHLLAAARTEYSKLDKPLPAADIRGWDE